MPTALDHAREVRRPMRGEPHDVAERFCRLEQTCRRDVRAMEQFEARGRLQRGQGAVSIDARGLGLRDRTVIYGPENPPSFRQSFGWRGRAFFALTHGLSPHRRRLP